MVPTASHPALVALAASSLTDALTEVASAYTRQTGQSVKLSFAASSALARQIEAGAPADVFFSADTDWMDYLDQRHLIAAGTRTDVLGNRLVLIAPADSKVQIDIASAPAQALVKALGNGRLATGDPVSVPVGRYARAVLSRFGAWESVRDRIAAADNVRTALAFVARGDAPLGIVYRTDALLEKRVRIVAEFPADSHDPITYPAAATARASPGAARFVEFLRSAPAQAIFHRFGFDSAP
jgi:molybdate transport system substrate-binding protein